MTRTRPAHRRTTAAAALVLLAGALLLGGSAVADQNEGPAPVAAAAQGRIAVGGLHSCAVLADGAVQCWGSNDQGQLGNGTTTTSTVPVTVPGVSGAVAVTAGNTHTCALLGDATVRCWGLAANGQVGDGSAGEPLHLQQRRTAVAVSGLTGVTSVAAGGFHTCAVLTDATVRCWGDDGVGQLGDGRGGDRSLTATAVPGLTGVRTVTAGEFHTCALLLDGRVRCWGHNGFRQLGDGGEADRAVPTAVAGLPDPGGDTPNPAVALTAGYGHTCVLLHDTTARCWGENSNGQLGYATDKGDDDRMRPSPVPRAVQHDSTPPSPSPTPDVLSDQDDVVALSAGQFHTCAALGSGTVRCWGAGARGQLGTDPDPFKPGIDDSTHTVDVQGLPAGAVGAVTAGGFHTCAVVGAGVQCWGYNFYGQLGSSAAGSPVPVQVTAVTGAESVSAGTRSACALLAAETPRRPVCWGDGGSGQLGAGTDVPRTTVRVPVAGIASADVLDAGDGHACALPAGEATPRCWGRGSSGQLGAGDGASRTTPVAVSGLTTATAVSAGGSGGQGHTCATTADTTVRCWGHNGNGQLGVEEPDGTTPDRSTPAVVRFDSDPEPGPSHVLLADLTGISAVTTGGSHTCGVSTDTTVWCWGANGAGQLGDGTVDERHHAVHVQDVGDTDPTKDTPLTGVLSVVAGAEHTCARRVGGSVVCWGANEQGQLGDGSTSGRRVPVETSGIGGSAPGATVLTAGDRHTCAVLANGALACWGGNGDGQLGDGSTSSRSTPTQVVGMDPTPSDVPVEVRPVIRSVSASRHNTCVALVDRTVHCWGDNSRDQLGDGIGAQSVVPRAAAVAGPV